MEGSSFKQQRPNPFPGPEAQKKREGKGTMTGLGDSVRMVVKESYKMLA